MDIYTDGSYIKGTASGAAVWLNDSGVSVRTKVNKVSINNGSEYCELLSIKLAIEVAVDNKAKSICIFNDHIGVRKKINGILSNKIITFNPNLRVLFTGIKEILTMHNLNIVVNPVEDHPYHRVAHISARRAIKGLSADNLVVEKAINQSQETKKDKSAKIKQKRGQEKKVSKNTAVSIVKKTVDSSNTPKKRHRLGWWYEMCSRIAFIIRMPTKKIRELNLLNQSQKYIFFLGGHDAEMMEIKESVLSQGCTVIDKGLSWGARVSDYKEELESISLDRIPVLVELAIDIAPPEDAIIIDHHNEKSGREAKTAIEQIAELLGITLNRYQQLISANDKGHIRGMRAICATEDEIRQIRQLDRRAQGVTEEDERLAEESIAKRLELIDEHTAIVRSLTNKTSPIFDRLYDKYSDIFVYTPDGEMNMSGRGETVMRLARDYELKKLKNPDLVFWYGGNLPESGYFGVKVRESYMMELSAEDKSFTTKN